MVALTMPHQSATTCFRQFLIGVYQSLIDGLYRALRADGHEDRRFHHAVRGFKDTDCRDIDRYAGTSARSSQKVLVSEAVLRGWDICTADISKACL